MQVYKQLLLVLGAVVVVLLIAGGIWVALRSPHDSTTPSSVSREGTPAHTAQPSFTTADATLLEQALNSSDKNEQAKALVPELRASSWQADTVLPAGATVAVDSHSFALEQNGQASVNATVSGSAEGNFVLHLTNVDGIWLINTTEMR